MGGNNPAKSDADAAPYEPGEDVLLRTGNEMPKPAPALELGSDGMPSGNCIVSGARLGSMGEPVVIEHGEHKVRFCCLACVAEFKKNPNTYLDALDAAKEGSRK